MRVGLIVCSLLMFLCTPVLAADAPRRVLALHDCRLDRPGGGGLAARCGVLTVPEDYDRPGGRLRRRRVAVVPALGPGGEPLFVLAGGPGQAATAFYAGVAPAFGPLARTHDIVLVDQRGTGGSARLDCRFPNDFSIRTPPTTASPWWWWKA